MNEVIKLLKLSPLQWEILKHRLEVPECIAEALDNPEAENCAEELERGNLRLAITEYGVELVSDVLEDAVSGCTYYGAASDQSPLQRSNILRSLDALAEKVGQYIGREVEYPDY